MKRTERHGIGANAVRALLACVALVAFAAVLAAGLSACGGSGGVAGACKCGSGAEKQMAELKLTLNDDKTRKLAGPDPFGGGEASRRLRVGRRGQLARARERITQAPPARGGLAAPPPRSGESTAKGGCPEPRHRCLGR